MGEAQIHLFLGPDSTAPGDARRELRCKLDQVVGSEVLEWATLLVSELVTNSVRHGGLLPSEKIELRVEASARRLRVEVAEPGRGFEAQPEPQPRRDATGGGATGGWGLLLVDRLSTAWGVENDGSTRVWFELDWVSD